VYPRPKTSEGKDPYHPRSLRAIGGVFSLFGRTSQPIGRTRLLDSARREGVHEHRNRSQIPDSIYLKPTSLSPKWKKSCESIRGRWSALRTMKSLSLSNADHSPHNEKSMGRDIRRTCQESDTRLQTGCCHIVDVYDAALRR